MFHASYEQIHLENLALTLKFIIESKRSQIKAKQLSSMSGLDGHVFGKNLLSLVKSGYLTADNTSRKSKYFVKDTEILKVYYEEIKSKLPKEFVDIVLGEV